MYLGFGKFKSVCAILWILNGVEWKFLSEVPVIVIMIMTTKTTMELKDNILFVFLLLSTHLKKLRKTNYKVDAIYIINDKEKKN